LVKAPIQNVGLDDGGAGEIYAVPPGKYFDQDIARPGRLLACVIVEPGYIVESMTGHLSRLMLEHYSHIQPTAKSAVLDRPSRPAGREVAGRGSSLPPTSFAGLSSRNPTNFECRK
jgi:hypothetical protein